MSNHYHVVLHVDKNLADSLSTKEVITRWQQLFKGTLLTQRFERGETLVKAELEAVNAMAEEWRSRLMDISWFIRCTNEWLARQANAEDGCTGRFWEGRFKSQALLDEKALAACMAYVDLNPIRAKMAKTPEESKHTSVQQRIKQSQKAIKKFKSPENTEQQPQSLFPFAGNPRLAMPQGLPFQLKDYLELVDWTGRQLREDKRGAIAVTCPPLLERLGISHKQWLYSATHFESRFKSLVGCVDKLQQACEKMALLRRPGLSQCREVFG